MKIQSIVLAVLFVLIACENDAQENKKIPKRSDRKSIELLSSGAIPKLPLQTNGTPVVSLRNCVDTNLQNKLMMEVNANVKWKKLVGQKKMAVGIVDLSDTSQVKFARLNGNVMLYAASLPKIGILLAVEDAIEKGELEDSETLRKKMRLMISKSSNTAATELMDLVGMEKIEQVLKAPEYDLYDEEFGGGLWVGKRYAKSGARHPDPLHGISHGATVSQVCRFYYLMAFGKLVSQERSEQMLGYMVDPEINHKFVNRLNVLAPKAKLYRKSGTWSTFHADSVLVWGPQRRYILVALIDSPDGEKIMRDLVLKVDKLLLN